MPKKVTPRGKAASAPKASPRATGKKPAKKAPAKRTPTQRFIRAIYSPAGGTRLTLDNGSRFELKPRGEINDCAPVSKEDMLDPKYIANKDVIFEEITAAEAKKIMEKQATNAQAPRRRSSVLDHIKDEYGNPVKGARMEQSFEQQGQTVAQISDGPGGRFTDGYQGTITRSPGEAPVQQAVAGSVQNPIPEIPNNIPPEQHADWLARNAEQLGVDAHGALRASVTPTQREIDPTDY